MGKKDAWWISLNIRLAGLIPPDGAVPKDCHPERMKGSQRGIWRCFTATSTSLNAWFSMTFRQPHLANIWKNQIPGYSQLVESDYVKELGDFERRSSITLLLQQLADSLHLSEQRPRTIGERLFLDGGGEHGTPEAAQLSDHHLVNLLDILQTHQLLFSP